MQVIFELTQDRVGIILAVLERFREWSFVHEDGGRMLALATERAGFELETRPSFEDVPSAFA